jgi:hypothetical protein
MHGEQWTRTRWCRIGFFVAAVLVTIGLVVGGFLGWLRGWPMPPFVVWLAAMLLWYLADRIARRFPVRAVDIAGGAITLVGVAPAFAEAVRDWESETRRIERPRAPDDRIRR